MKTLYRSVWRRVSQEVSRAQGDGSGETLLAIKKPLTELGLDSLKLIEIVYELETFYQLDVDEERLSELRKVGDLVELFVSAQSADAEPVMQGEEGDCAR